MNCKEKNMKLSLIAAVDDDFGIGKNGQLLWHLPKDLKWMKEKTMGFPILMGYNTYLDIIKYSKGKPLPGRTNIVLTKNNRHKINENFITISTPEELESFKHEKVFIIGGEKIYNIFINMADEIILTHVHKKYNADTFFPKFNLSNFLITEEIDDFENDINFTFTTYTKKI